MSFAIGVRTPRPQQRAPPRRHIPQAGLSRVPIKIDMPTFLAPKTSLLKHHKNAPMAFQIAVSSVGQSFQKRKEYLEKIRTSYKRLNTLLDTFTKNDHMHTYIQVLRWFKMEAKLKAKLRPIFYAWIQKKYKARMLNTEDPFTLCEPDNPVYVFDAKSRGTYVFDGKSIKKHIESCLGYNRWMIPEPREPTNPLTNLVLTHGQLIAIRNQLCKHGIGSWMIEGLAKVNYNIAAFDTEFKLPLRLYALDDLYRNPTSEDSLDELTEFISEQHKNQTPTITEGELIALRWAVMKMTHDPYIAEWRTLWRDYFKKYLIDPTIFRSDTSTKNLMVNRINGLFYSKELKRIREEFVKNCPRILNSPAHNHLDLNTLLAEILTQYQVPDIYGNDAEEESEEANSGGGV